MNTPPTAAVPTVFERALAEQVVPLGVVDAGRPEDGHASDRLGARVHLASDAVLVGPWGIRDDGDAPCGHCLAIRWQRLRATAQRDALETGSVSSRTGAWPPPTAFLVDTTRALLEAIRQAPGGRRSGTPPGGGAGRAPGTARVTRLDLATLRPQTVELLADPLCPSHPTLPFPRTSYPPVAPATGQDDVREGLRLRAATDYDLPVGALVNPVCGALGPVVAEDLLGPTTAAVSGHFFERARDGLHDIGWSGKSGSFATSRALALLEGLERYAGTRPRRQRAVVVDSLGNLGDAALDPRTCGEYPAETYDSDPTLHRFSPDDRIPWLWGHSLRDDRPVLVPMRSAYYSVGSPADDFVFECSNGCATGSRMEEAVLFGLLELVERDAFLLGWYAGTPVTELDLPTVPGVRRQLDRAALHGYDVKVFDSRADVDVPVVTALAVRRDGGPGRLAFAAAADLDPARAVTAALGEALTYLPHLGHEARKRRRELELMAADFDRVTQLRDHALLFALPDSAVHARRYLEPDRRVRFEDAYQGTARCTDPGTAVRRLVDRIAAAGCDVIVVDQTTPEQERAGLSTVRTLAPGLLPVDFGWRRQRALTMPRLRTAWRAAGLVPHDLTDADLHRVPHPFP